MDGNDKINGVARRDLLREVMRAWAPQWMRIRIAKEPRALSACASVKRDHPRPHRRVIGSLAEHLICAARERRRIASQAVGRRLSAGWTSRAPSLASACVIQRHVAANRQSAILHTYALVLPTGYACEPRQRSACQRISACLSVSWRAGSKARRSSGLTVVAQAQRRASNSELGRTNRELGRLAPHEIKVMALIALAAGQDRSA